MADLSRYEKSIGQTDCSCAKCREICKRRVCWPSPLEARRMILAGYATKMMLDYWEGDERVYIACPASKGNEGKISPWDPTGPCAIQDEDGLCPLHERGLKPIEGRLSACVEKNPAGHVMSSLLHAAIAEAWDSIEGRKVVEAWQYAVNLKEEVA